jgi:hypothetical protein
MTNLEGMPSYFWLTSSRLKQPVQNDIHYTTQALCEDLRRVRNAWDDCQAKRDRDAIYSYLTAVFDLVAWWAAEDRAVSRGRWALKLQGVDPTNADEPFAAIILCTSDPSKVDKRTRSKWSRVLRYAMEYKPSSEPLAAFIRRKGGINKCADRFGLEAGPLSQWLYSVLAEAGSPVICVETQLLTRVYGPAVRCKRISPSWRMCALASMYPAFDWSLLCSAPSWISARRRGKAKRTRAGNPCQVHH